VGLKNVYNQDRKINMGEEKSCLRLLNNNMWQFEPSIFEIQVMCNGWGM
jgi:hypothetical protein